MLESGWQQPGKEPPRSVLSNPDSSASGVRKKAPLKLPGAEGEMNQNPEGQALIPEKNLQVLKAWNVRPPGVKRTRSGGTGQFHRPVRCTRKGAQVSITSVMQTLPTQEPFPLVSAGNQSRLRV